MQAAYNTRLAAVHEAAIKRQEREAQRWRQHTAALARFRAPQVTPSLSLQRCGSERRVFILCPASLAAVSKRASVLTYVRRAELVSHGRYRHRLGLRRRICQALWRGRALRCRSCPEPCQLPQAACVA